jgi:integrase
MRGAELDLKAATWTIPGARTKNSYQHTVPLSALATKLIREALADAGDSNFVFPNPSGTGSLPAAAVARTIARAHESDGRFGIDHFTTHDCRRSAVSYMAQLGVSPIVLGHVINHRSVTKAGVTLSAYSHYDYAKERRDALDLWADRLQAIIENKAAVVVPMQRERK